MAAPIGAGTYVDIARNTTLSERERTTRLSELLRKEQNEKLLACFRGKGKWHGNGETAHFKSTPHWESVIANLENTVEQERRMATEANLHRLAAAAMNAVDEEGIGDGVGFKYKCGRCGKPKKGHTCEMTKTLKEELWGAQKNVRPSPAACPLEELAHHAVNKGLKPEPAIPPRASGMTYHSTGAGDGFGDSTSSDSKTRRHDLMLKLKQRLERRLGALVMHNNMHHKADEHRELRKMRPLPFSFSRAPLAQPAAHDASQSDGMRADDSWTSSTRHLVPEGDGSALNWESSGCVQSSGHLNLDSFSNFSSCWLPGSDKLRSIRVGESSKFLASNTGKSSSAVDSVMPDVAKSVTAPPPDSSESSGKASDISDKSMKPPMTRGLSDSKGGVLRSSLRSITDSGSLRSITDAGRLRSISEAGLAGVKRRHSGSGGGADTGADTGDTGSCGDDGNSKARPTLTHHSTVKSAASSKSMSELDTGEQVSDISATAPASAGKLATDTDAKNKSMRPPTTRGSSQRSIPEPSVPSPKSRNNGPEQEKKKK